MEHYKQIPYHGSYHTAIMCSCDLILNELVQIQASPLLLSWASTSISLNLKFLFEMKIMIISTL